MFKHIMVPYDLAAREKCEKSVKVAGDLARLYDAGMTLVTVSGSFDGTGRQSVEEKRRLLEGLAAHFEQSSGVTTGSRVYEVPDSSVEVVRKLIAAIEDTGADLVVMASHQPGWVEYLVNSNAGSVASHARVSVLVVRG